MPKVANQENGSPALAQMIHMTDLFSWLVQTAGKALAVLVLIPLALGIAGAFIDPEGDGLAAGIAFGSALSILVLLMWLPTATAPFPREHVIELLDIEADQTPAAVNPGAPSVKILGPTSAPRRRRRRPRRPQ